MGCGDFIGIQLCWEQNHNFSSFAADVGLFQTQQSSFTTLVLLEYSIVLRIGSSAFVEHEGTFLRISTTTLWPPRHGDCSPKKNFTGTQCIAYQIAPPGKPVVG